jgi:hypothetical protein
LASDAKRATAAETASLVAGDAPKVKLGATHGHTNTEPADPRSEGGRKAEEEHPATDGAKKAKKEGSREVGTLEVDPGDVGRQEINNITGLSCPATRSALPLTWRRRMNLALRRSCRE